MANDREYSGLINGYEQNLTETERLLGDSYLRFTSAIASKPVGRGKSNVRESKPIFPAFPVAGGYVEAGLRGAGRTV